MKLTVNGKVHDVAIPEDMPLLWVLRDVLGLTGTKFGCGMAQCGACTVLVDGSRCARAYGRRRRRGEVASRRSRASAANGDHPVQQAWAELTSCNAATASPARSWRPSRSSKAKPQPTDGDIDAALSGNICRCGTYQRIRGAVHRAAALMKG